MAEGDYEAAEQAVSEALTNADLVALRQTVTDATATWSGLNDTYEGLVSDVDDAELALDEAQSALDAAVLACQVLQFDEYREALEQRLLERRELLGELKTALEAEAAAAPAPGEAGSRCEKALSNGTWRPGDRRGEAGECAEGLCCGAARVWMDIGDAGQEEAAWRTIETCQSEEATTYDYQPPRESLAVALPAVQQVPFACIEGAKKLAAAAAAAADALYSLA